jgi:hypothetical protein
MHNETLMTEHSACLAMRAAHRYRLAGIPLLPSGVALLPRSTPECTLSSDRSPHLMDVTQFFPARAEASYQELQGTQSQEQG